MPPISLTIESSVRHSARTKPISKAVDQSGEDALELPLSKGREKRMRVPSMKQQALNNDEQEKVLRAKEKVKKTAGRDLQAEKQAEITAELLESRDTNKNRYRSSSPMMTDDELFQTKAVPALKTQLLKRPSAIPTPPVCKLSKKVLVKSSSHGSQEVRAPSQKEQVSKDLEDPGTLPQPSDLDSDNETDIGDEDAMEDVDAMDVDEGDNKGVESEQEVDDESERAKEHNSRKRSHPATTDVATTHVSKQRQQRKNQKSCVRVAARDFSVITQAILSNAKHHYRCHIVTRGPYPERWEEVKNSDGAWRLACDIKGVQIEFNNALRKLITQYGAHVRGELKTKARPIVKKAFGLANPALKKCQKRKAENRRKAQVNRMRVKVDDLLNEDSFLYKDTKAHTGYFLNPLIQEIINEMWFTNRGDEGLEYEAYFNPISEVTIALVATVIENILDEWASGEHHQITFSSTGYSDKFEAHLMTVEVYADKSPAVFEAWRTKLLRKARANAGVIDDIHRRTRMTEEALDIALAELANYDMEDDTDNEDGDEEIAEVEE